MRALDTTGAIGEESESDKPYHGPGSNFHKWKYGHDYPLRQEEVFEDELVLGGVEPPPKKKSDWRERLPATTTINEGYTDIIDLAQPFLTPAPTAGEICADSSSSICLHVRDSARSGARWGEMKARINASQNMGFAGMMAYTQMLLLPVSVGETVFAGSVGAMAFYGAGAAFEVDQLQRSTRQLAGDADAKSGFAFATEASLRGLGFSPSEAARSAESAEAITGLALVAGTFVIRPRGTTPTLQSSADAGSRGKFMDWFNPWGDLGGQTTITGQGASYTGRLAWLNKLGLRQGMVPHIQNYDAGGHWAARLDTQAHEGVHAILARYVPSVWKAGDATVAGVPVGAPVKYLEEVVAYSVGHIASARIHAVPFAPVEAFGSLTAAERLTTIVFGGLVGGGYYFGVR